MKRLRFTIALVLFSVCLVANALASPPSLVTAGKLDQPRVRWSDRTIKIAISTSMLKRSPNIKVGSDVIGAVERSLDAWRAVADIEFQLDRSDKQSVSPTGEADGTSVITVAGTPENVLFFGSDTQAVSAQTRVFHLRGVITEADIALNPFQQFSTDGTFGTFDLQSTLTHEIGHLLGVKHSGVLGSVMYEKLAKVGALGLADLGTRTLAESDISAVRDLYGANTEKDECCGVVLGKLTLPVGKSLKNLRVWAEDGDSGRVLGQAEVAADGKFRLGGLPLGTQKFYWKAKSGATGSFGGELGDVKVEKAEAATLNQKISVGPSLLSLDFFGQNGQLGESGISVENGREQIIYVGGKGLDSRTVEIEFSSPFIRAVPATTVNQDFGDGVSVVSLYIVVAPQTPPGVYSVFARGQDGSRTAALGALKIN